MLIRIPTALIWLSLWTKQWTTLMPERMWAEEVTGDLDLSLDLAIEQVDEPRYGFWEHGGDRRMKILRGDL